MSTVAGKRAAPVAPLERVVRCCLALLFSAGLGFVIPFVASPCQAQSAPAQNATPPQPPPDDPPPSLIHHPKPAPAPAQPTPATPSDATKGAATPDGSAPAQPAAQDPAATQSTPQTAGQSNAVTTGQPPASSVSSQPVSSTPATDSAYIRYAVARATANSDSIIYACRDGAKCRTRGLAPGDQHAHFDDAAGIARQPGAGARGSS